ncbi:MAG: serine/threonine protein kinase [Planctomycetota bacterium]|nr:MAG: serine/threonine protein kinase [Planctomycetota bacterium]
MSTRRLSKRFTDFTDFTLTRVLGEGGMGTVYAGWLHGAAGFQKLVAIKILLERFSEDPDFIDKLVTEAKLMANLVHTNIVQIYRLGVVEGNYYILMEYINGATLSELIDRHVEMNLQVRLDIGLFIVSRVCGALDYAHRRLAPDGTPLKIVHRDICPNNIMITVEGVVKLTDFGVSKNDILKDEEEGEVVVGKLSYMSPEQADFRLTDHRSDLYSLGIVMYELLTGENPFITSADEKTPNLTSVVLGKTVRGSFKKPREINPGLSPEVERIILKAMEKDVDRRYQTAADMGFDIERCLSKSGFKPGDATMAAYLREICPDLPNRGDCPVTPWEGSKRYQTTDKASKENLEETKAL